MMEANEMILESGVRCLPILFNTDMVWALQGRRKTVTRRVVRPQPKPEERDFSPLLPVVPGKGRYKPHIRFADENGTVAYKPYQLGDILYVRETWSICDNLWDGTDIVIYRAGYTGGQNASIKWRPPFHMPHEFARIFLRVTGMRVERLQDTFFEEGSAIFALRSEGADIGNTCRKCIGTYGRPCCIDDESECGILDDVRSDFADLWDSTLKPADRALYGWAANPWVWVIEFDLCEKPEGWPA